VVNEIISLLAVTSKVPLVTAVVRSDISKECVPRIHLVIRHEGTDLTAQSESDADSEPLTLYRQG